MSPNKRGPRLWAIAFWLIAWHLASVAVGRRVLLASPVETILRLGELIREGSFWSSVLFTMTHIGAGFLAAVICGVLLAALSARFRILRELLEPPLAAIRSVPVASFVIVALIWVPSERLSVLISFLISLPILYSDTLGGIGQADRKLLEMAEVFHMRPLARILHIYLPAALPRFRTALSIALGLAWKSGVAAEVIGVPGGSIGEKLYRAKIYLATPDLFAWTLTIVILSMLCEKGLRLLTDRLARRMEES